MRCSVIIPEGTFFVYGGFPVYYKSESKMMKKYWIQTLTAVLVVCGAWTAMAQQSQDSLKILKANLDSALESGSKVSDGFGNYLKVTWGNPDNETRLPEYRGALLKYLKDSEGQKGAPDLLALVFKTMKGYAEDEKAEKILRLNALLVIGELNASVSNDGFVPLPESKAVLLAFWNKTLESDTYLRVVALKGLVRYAAGKSAPTDKKELGPAFLKMASVKSKGDGTPEAPEVIWMRMTAIEGLGNLGDPTAAPLLLGIIADDENFDIPTRTVAAVAFSKLQKLDEKSLGNVKPGDAVRSLGILAAQSLAVEYDRKFKLQRGLEGEEARFTRGMAATTQMDDEQNALMTLSLRRRVKAVASVFSGILNGNSNLLPLLKSKADRELLDKLTKSLRSINSMYDEIGQVRVKTEKTDTPDDAGMATRNMQTEGEPSYYYQRWRLYSPLKDMFGYLGQKTSIKTTRTAPQEFFGTGMR